jgi:ribonuclease HI
MPWIKHRLRDSDVWAKVDTSGALVTDRDGRVEIVYKAVAGAKTYRAGARNLTPVGGAPVEFEAGEAAPEKPAANAVDKKAAPPAAPADAIQVWADGACTGNPGPAGLGVVVLDGTEKQELSEYLGEGTNNIAELTAILRAAQYIPASATAVLHTDSQYSIGVLTKGWKAKANQELIADVKKALKDRPTWRIVYVPGHAGVPLNERADELAREAVKTGRSRLPELEKRD